MDALPPPPPQRSPAKTIRPRTAPVAVFATFILIASSPFAVWWGYGNQDECPSGLDPIRDPHAFMRMFDPPDIAPSTEFTIGIVATFLAIGALFTLVTCARAGRLDQRWLPSIAGCVGVGIMVGMAERTMTAATIGANIDGGVMLLTGTPMVAILVVGSAAWTIRVFRTSTPAPAQEDAPKGASDQ